MTIRKVKSIFNSRTSGSQYVLHSLNEHTKVKRRANKSFSVALTALLLAVFTVLIGYFIISDEDIFTLDKSSVNFILLTPQEIQSNSR